jgi:hypothetical protein
VSCHIHLKRFFPCTPEWRCYKGQFTHPKGTLMRRSVAASRKWSLIEEAPR